MNKFFSLLAFLFVISTASKAQQLITFKALGHDDDMIYGMSGANSFYFKITPLTEMNGSKVVLFFEPSQALLKDHSYINVVINNKPVYSGRMTKDSIQKIALTLTRADLSNDKFLKIQIKTLLTITDDECRDLDNPGMWLKIKNYSYLSLRRSNKGFFDNVNISNCFDSKKAIVYPANPTLADLKAVAWAYSRLKKTQTRDIMVYDEAHMPDTLRNYIKVGLIGKLNADARQLIKVTPQNDQGLFYLHKSMSLVTDTNTRLVDVKGVLTAVKTATQEMQPKEILFVTGGGDDGYEKAITALGNMNILNSTFGDYLLIEKAQNTFSKTIDENRSKLSLKQVGGVSDFLAGIGSLKSAYSFKNSDFSFTPKEVEIRFVANYSALSVGDRGFFNIYLNGLLISSEKLDGTGKLNTAITINRYQHHKYNTLEAEFRFYPTAGHCKDSFTNFFAEVDVDKSYLESKNPFITSDLSFYQYPEAFNTGTTRIIISKEYAKYAAGALGEIIYELNNNINANNFPEFDYSTDFPSNDLKKYNIIALLSKNDKLLKEFQDAPIQFERDFRLYKTDDNTTVYSLSDTVSNGLAQIFYGRSNNATLVLTATGTHIAEAFLATSKSITEQLSTLSSNVCISDVNSNKYLFNINKSSANLEYIDTKSGLTRFWDTYNLYILLGILILILLSFLYVRSRVQKSQDLFND